MYYRIHVLPIRLPPLRERKEDVPLLVEHFLKSTALLQKGKPITPGFLEALQAYDWPGNVRESCKTPCIAMSPWERLIFRGNG